MCVGGCAAQYGTACISPTCMYCYCAVPVAQGLVGWAAIFSHLPHLSTVAWRPVPRRRMPRDATRSFSRSDSSTCAIRCRLLLVVLELCFLLPWRAAFLSLPPFLCSGLLATDYGVGRLRCWPGLACTGVHGLGHGLGPPTWVCISHSQRDRQSC